VPERNYEGTELELFANAFRWKSYWRVQIASWVRGKVLEVGAGLGANTSMLCDPSHELWMCLEPDPIMAEGLERAIAVGLLPAGCHVRRGTIDDLAPKDRFDAVLYVDVLEHIEDDRGELSRAAEHLAPGGSLIVLSPAHQALFSPFDEAIGHFRRYDRRLLSAIAPRSVELTRLRYLDSVGMLTSLANRFVLSQSLPTRGQLAFWDRCLVPVSRLLDPLLGYRVGRSILAVWVRS
jgi:SAM-dependent methyltransferase